MPAISAATASDSTNVASTNTDSIRSRLAPISEKPFETSHDAHVMAKRASASSPRSTSASWPSPRFGAACATGTTRTPPTSAAATTNGASR